MRILIIGCGYVGLALGTELVSQGHEVYGLRRTRRNENELTVAGLVPLSGDITQPETLRQARARYDWVVLCVASASGGPAEYRRVYLQGGSHVIDWLAATPPQKFIYTSSSSVYGQTDGSVVDETSPTQPVVETSRILLETEQILLETGRKASVPTVVLRLAGIYGPGRGYWFKQYLRGEARLEGRGQRVLNMIHRDDVVGATIRALEGAQPGEIFNVVDDEPVTQLRIFEWLAGRLGWQLPTTIPEESAPARKRGLTSKRVSNRKLKEQLGYRLKYPSFREGCEAELRDRERSAQAKGDL